MADKTADADHFARDPRITGAAASSMNALKPLMLFQVSMLGMWAHSIERFADNYESCERLPMYIRDVAPHWSMAKIDLTYECSNCDAEIRQTVTKPELLN